MRSSPRRRADFHVVLRPTRDQLRRRVPQLAAGLVCLALGVELSVRAALGLAPWDVLHQGIARRLGISLGTVVILVGLVVLLLWIPLRQPLGVGTVANAICLGLLINTFAWLIPVIHNLAARWAALLGGLVVLSVGVGLYIGAGLGPGPRDGLMTGIARRGHPLWAVRTALELTALIAGWFLGGSVGIGTVILALGIGPLSAPLLHLLHRRAPVAPLGLTGE